MYVGIAFVREKLYGPRASGARLGDMGKVEWACPLDCFGHSDRPVGIDQCGGYGWIAQLVEQRTENPCVPGSNPGPATISFFPNVTQPHPSSRVPGMAQPASRRRILTE